MDPSARFLPVSICPRVCLSLPSRTAETPFSGHFRPLINCGTWSQGVLVESEHVCLCYRFRLAFPAFVQRLSTASLLMEAKKKNTWIMWTFKWLPDPVHSWWEFDLYTGAAPGSPACGRVRNSVTLYLPPCTCFQKKKKNVGVDGCKLQGAGNKAKSTSVGGLSIKARSFPLVVQGSRTGIPSLSTSAWPIIPVRFHSSSSFV